MPTINQTLFKKNSPKQSALDSGSPESQIALFTHRIEHIINHLKEHKKDHTSRLSLVKIVQKRKKQLSYLAKQDITRYKTICTNLSLRK